MDVTRQIESAHRYMKDFHKSDYSGHDVAHVERVTSLAQTISKCEQQGEYLIITLSALLHDVIDDKLTNKANALDCLKTFLKNIRVSSDQQQKIIYIIQHLSYRNGQNNHVDLPIEGQIVRDADRLDAIGAIGIARAFQFSGHFNEPMWTESPHSDIPNIETITNLEPSAIRHFYDKLLKLKDLMHTETGRKLARERHAFMEQFLNQFYKEWHI
ncbi:HD domain-containing protein [Staphylococcus haemolyticus]|uniref:Phosphohydrolase n=1 Tax=Staphylococcus haemolyticus TaxID=1283 RepID=A0A7Z1MWU6_STAHA|nr:HD domain-containing protein [Staphylococcus haemolyticus]MBK3925262.1 HD domain-containing protein [Staphylococcus haemolyticus]MBK3949611.1 HD domain-containing protein [Staphylococcus haemolyticus]MCH4323703.1 HD domain-containing protein [Staphylococcus haemolyticus]PPJ68464.1 phosphohydrolase [Staphylococcus haemolyticus]TJX23612.1 HD domain-containing protein [Staphylococcus haemolyticus]